MEQIEGQEEGYGWIGSRLCRVDNGVRWKRVDRRIESSGVGRRRRPGKVGIELGRSLSEMGVGLEMWPDWEADEGSSVDCSSSRGGRLRVVEDSRIPRPAGNWLDWSFVRVSVTHGSAQDSQSHSGLRNKGP